MILSRFNLSVMCHALLLLLFVYCSAAAQINPVHTASVQHGEGAVPYLSSPTSMFVSGHFAYITSSATHSLEIVDITNPFAPQHKGSIVNGSNGALLSSPNAVVVQGNYAYVLSAGNNALEIIDVSDPSAPEHKGV